MTEERHQLLAHYREMRRDLLSTIEGLTDAQLVEPSLDGWSVKDHLAHIALWDDLRSAEVRRISAGHASAWRMAGEQDAVLGALVYELRRDLSLEQVRWELDDSHHRLLEALAGATAAGLAA
ncbi:MAG: DinB family protein, partial [Dehalococcoidia bacterium]